GTRPWTRSQPALRAAGRRETMEPLKLDLNNRNARGEVRVGPAALARHAALREHRISPGDRVEVVDVDGNRCMGVVREDPERRLSVELDWTTWVDGPDLVPPHD